MKLRIPLKKSTKLQLRFVGGMLVVTPGWWLAYQLPMFNDCPLWFMIAFPAGVYVAALIWFRQQCMSPDKTSFKFKWR
jgi:uncharacterized membrane protein